MVPPPGIVWPTPSHREPEKAGGAGGGGGGGGGAGPGHSALAAKPSAPTEPSLVNLISTDEAGDEKVPGDEDPLNSVPSR